MNDIEKLCLRAREGDLEAASELVGLHYEKIFSYSARKPRNSSSRSQVSFNCES